MCTLRNKKKTYRNVLLIVTNTSREFTAGHQNSYKCETMGLARDLPATGLRAMAYFQRDIAHGINNHISIASTMISVLCQQYCLHCLNNNVCITSTMMLVLRQL